MTDQDCYATKGKSRLLTFGRWPSDHDLDLLVDPGVELTRTFSADAVWSTGTVASPVDLAELGTGLCGTLAHLARRVAVPLDVFLDCREQDFNLGLWIEVDRPWRLSWRYCGRDFFLGALPYEAAS